MSALWISALAETALRATALLGIAALLTLFLRRRAATTRHLVWGLALAGVLVLPLAGVVLPGVPVPIPRALTDALPASLVATVAVAPVPENTHLAPDGADARSGSDLGTARGAAAEAGDAARPGVTTAAESSSGGSQAPTEVPVSSLTAAGTTSAWAPVLLAIWGIGATASGLWVLAGVRNTRLLAADAKAVTPPDWLEMVRDIAAQLGIRRPVRLLQSERAATPITWGWRRPVIVVPAAATGWSPERKAVVLKHELAHVGRGDVVTQLLARLVCALYWFNPAVWFAAYRLRVERERACDDEVLRLGTRASDYANHLLDIALQSHGPGPRASAAVAMARRSQLEGRMRAILDPKAKRTAGRATAFLAAAVLTAATLVASATTSVPQTRRATAAPDAAGEQDPRDQTDVLLGVQQPVPAPTSVARPPVQRPEAATAITETELPGRTMQSERQPEAQRVVEQGEEATVSAGRAQGRGQEGPGCGESDALTGGGSLVVTRNAQAFTQANKLTSVVYTHALRFLEAIQAEVECGIEVTEMTLQVEGQGIAGLYNLGFVPEEEQPGTPETARRLLARLETPREIDPRLVETFIGALTDSDPDVRERSVHALGRLRVSTAAAALQGALEDETAAVRDRAAWALERMSSPPEADEEADDLTALMLEEGALAIHGKDLEELIGDLGLLGDERALEALIALMDARNPEVRRAAIDALSNARWPSPEEPEPPQAARPSEPTDSPGPTSPSASTSPDHGGPADPPEVEPQPSPPGG